MGDPCDLALAEYPRLVSPAIYSKMADGDVERVIGAVRGVVARHCRPRVRVTETERAHRVAEAAG